MALQAGTRLGPYEVLSLLGAGGTGEVYQAQDTRLDRKVAVKVLAPQLASEAEFRVRFEREAKAISSLDHPHICGLYDIGREHGTEYLGGLRWRRRRSSRRQIGRRDHPFSERPFSLECVPTIGLLPASGLYSLNQ